MVIVGGGLAGVSAAVEAVKAKATVTLLEKAQLPRTHSPWVYCRGSQSKEKAITEVCHEFGELPLSSFKDGLLYFRRPSLHSTKTLCLGSHATCHTQHTSYDTRSSTLMPGCMAPTLVRPCWGKVV